MLFFAGGTEVNEKHYRNRRGILLLGAILLVVLLSIAIISAWPTKSTDERRKREADLVFKLQELRRAMDLMRREYDPNYPVPTAEELACGCEPPKAHNFTSIGDAIAKYLEMTETDKDAFWTDYNPVTKKLRHQAFVDYMKKRGIYEDLMAISNYSMGTRKNELGNEQIFTEELESIIGDMKRAGWLRENYSPPRLAVRALDPNKPDEWLVDANGVRYRRICPYCIEHRADYPNPSAGDNPNGDYCNYCKVNYGRLQPQIDIELLDVGWRITVNRVSSSSFESPAFERLKTIRDISEESDLKNLTRWWFTTDKTNVKVITDEQPPHEEDYPGQTDDSGHRGKYGQRVLMIQGN